MSDPENMPRRRFLKRTGAAATAVAIAGCGGDGDGDSPTTTDDGPTDTTEPTNGGTTEETTTSQVDTGGTMNRIMTGTVRSGFDPVAVANTAAGFLQSQVVENLVTYPDGEPEVEGRLATGYDNNEDYTEFTFELKEGVTFHNGDDFTADDVVYSWERLAGSPHTIRQNFILDILGIEHERNGDGEYVSGSLGVEAVDDTTFRFTTEEAYANSLTMIAYGAYAVIPDGIVGDPSDEVNDEGDPSDQYQEFHTSNLIGTGPFTFGGWTPQESYYVEKNDDYHVEDRPYLDEIQWVIIEQPEAIYQTSVSGDVDVAVIPDSRYSRDKLTIDREEATKKWGTYGPLDSGEMAGENLDWFQTTTASTFYIGFDMGNTPHAVRQAAAHAADQEEFNQSIFKGRDEPAYALTPPPIFPGGAEEYNSFVEENYPYGFEAQISEAQQVMEDAGYSEDDPYELTINSYVGPFATMAEELASRLRSAHMEVEVVPTQFADIIQTGMNGNLQCWTLGWIADWPAPDNFLQLIYPPNTDVSELGPSSQTYGSWGESDNQEFVDQATQGYETIQNNGQPTDAAEEARNQAVLDMELVNWNDVYLIMVTHGTSERFTYPHVNQPPFGLMGQSRQTQEETWLEQE